MTVMRHFLQDMRYTFRQFKKSAGFTLVEAVILRPLPFHSPDRLVWLNGKFSLSDKAAVSPPDFRDYRAGNRTFECFAAMGYSAGPSNLSAEKPEQVLTSIASANFFECLGIRPLLGRDFVSADEQVNEPQVAILGHGVWKRNFGGQKNIVGTIIRIDGEVRTIIGVLPSDIPLLSEAQIWLPTPMLNRFMNIRMSHSLKA